MNDGNAPKRVLRTCVLVLLAAIYLGSATSTLTRAAFASTMFDTLEMAPQEESVGGDWHAWRSYSSEYQLDEDLRVLFSNLDEGTGMAVYDAESGGRIGTLLFPEGITVEDVWQEALQIADRDGDGILDIGLEVRAGGTLWFRFLPELLGTWPEPPDGCFLYQCMDDTAPTAAPPS